MLKALLWKEWRTQRSLVLAGLVMALLLPAFLMAGALVTETGVSLYDLSVGLVPLYVLLVWPVFAAATGGNAFAADRGDESLRLLLSRPVSRTRVWTIKAVVAAAAFGSVVVGSTLIALVAVWLSRPRNPAFRDVFRSAVDQTLHLGTAVIAGLFIILFFCALYTSTFARRPLAAACGGFLVALAMLGAMLSTWWIVFPSFSNPLMNPMFASATLTAVPLAAAGCVIAAFVAFRRVDLFEPVLRRRLARPLVIVWAVVGLASVSSAAYSGIRHAAERAADHIGDLQIHDGHFLAVERTARGFGTVIVRRSIDGMLAGELAGPQATKPVLSPDGEWVVYVAYDRYPAGAGPDAHLRAVRADGSDDHPISGDLPGWSAGYRQSSLLVAPDGDSVVFVGHPNPLLATISGDPRHATVFPLDATGEDRRVVRRAGVIGWVEGTPARLLYWRVVNRFSWGEPHSAGTPTDWGGAMRRTELRALDPATGVSRTIRTFDGSHDLSLWGTRVFHYGARPSRAWRWLPVWLDGDEAESLQLVDVRSGESVELSRTPCANWGFSAAGDRFLYANCNGRLRDGDARIEVREYDVATGADEQFAVLEGYELQAPSIRGLFLSPAGDRLLLYARRGYDNDWDTRVVSRDGTVRALEGGSGFPVGWLDEDEALLMSVYGNRLQRVDVHSGVTRTIFR